MAVEYEVKFAAEQGAFDAIKGRYEKLLRPIAMETTYFDTPTGALSARRYTLRSRMENGVCICTLKTPAKVGRNEWETQCGDIQKAIPGLCRLGGPEELMALTAGGVVPICGAAFTRLAATLELEGAAVELALDAGVLLGAGRETPLMEVEVELKAGSPAVLEAFAKALAAEFGLKNQPLSKFRRALALTQSKQK